MRSRTRRWVMTAVAVAATGTLFTSGNLACTSFFANAAQTSIDMCFLFDCQNGAIGGLIKPCGQPNPDIVDNQQMLFPNQTQTFNPYLTGQLFVDCPVQVNP